VAASYDTGFVEARLADLVAPAPAPPPAVVAIAAFAALHRLEHAGMRSRDPSDPFSPWRDVTGWRLGARAALDLRLGHGGGEIAVAARWVDGGYELGIGSERLSVTGTVDRRGQLALRVGEERVRAKAVFEGDRLTLFVDGSEFAFGLIDPRRPPPMEEEAGGHLSSPVPGLVVAVMAKVGTIVEKGAPLVLVEAMKMEHAVTAPHSGRIQAVRVNAGDQVAAGAELVVIEAVP